MTMLGEVKILAMDREYDSDDDLPLARLYSDREKVKTQEKIPSWVNNTTDISMKETSGYKQYENHVIIEIRDLNLEQMFEKMFTDDIIPNKKIFSVCNITEIDQSD